MDEKQLQALANELAKNLKTPEVIHAGVHSYILITISP
ncbi:transposase [Escherichia coli]|nr:transposase [Escherichia coli]